MPEHKRQFEQGTKNLMACIDVNPHDYETIRFFLCSFAEHVIGHIVPSDLQQSSTIKSIKQIAQDIDDMEQVP